MGLLVMPEMAKLVPVLNLSAARPYSAALQYWERPADCLKLIASIIPKELHVKEQSLEDMSDEELFATIDMIRSLMPGDRKH
jgi:hypothetical protein